MTRLFITIQEAISEVRRDVAEIGICVHPLTVQNKDVSQDDGYDTMELQNYTYTILSPSSEEIRPFTTQPYCDIEWVERKAGIEGHPCNPGQSWKSRPEVWEELLESGRFSYAYSERFSYFNQVETIIERLKKDPDSRQLYVSIWEPQDITKIGGRSRIPCSLGYLLQFRQGKLNLSYIQRSSDLITHFNNDVFFAVKFLEYISERTGLPVGTFTHFIGSLHVFKRDVKDVF